MEQHLSRKVPIRRLEKEVSSSDEPDKANAKPVNVKRPRRSKPKVKTGVCILTPYTKGFLLTFMIQCITCK